MSFQNPKAREVGELKRMGLTPEEILEQLRANNEGGEIERGPARDNERPTPKDIATILREERERIIPNQIECIDDVRRAIKALTNDVKEEHLYGAQNQSNLKLVGHEVANGKLRFAEFQIDREINNKNQEVDSVAFLYLADTKKEARFTRQRFKRDLSIDGEEKLKLVERKKEAIVLPTSLKEKGGSVLLKINQEEQVEATVLHEWEKSEEAKEAGRVYVTLRRSGEFPTPKTSE